MCVIESSRPRNRWTFFARSSETAAALADAAANPRFTYPKDGVPATPPLASKIVDVPLKRGQRVRLETPGGGGYGAPGDRSPAAIQRDIELGFVTPAAVRRDYGGAA
jgi:N-methylhydantoinase B